MAYPVIMWLRLADSRKKLDLDLLRLPAFRTRMLDHFSTLEVLII